MTLNVFAVVTFPAVVKIVLHEPLDKFKEQWNNDVQLERCFVSVTHQ